MIGALIGDIAAWTYENDIDTFWKQLIPDKGRAVDISVYGHALMRAASKNVLDVQNQEVGFIRTCEDWSPKEWLHVSGQRLMWQLMCAWDNNKDHPDGMEYNVPFEKEDGYARRFVINLIRALRTGKTKSEAYHSEEMFESLSKTWKWRKWQNIAGTDHEYSLLTHIFRAWDSFYRGFDFTSSLHNAMKWDGDRHLIAMLTGAFADAMYGSEQSFIKKKYAKGGQTFHSNDITIVGEAFGYHHGLIKEMADISFTNRTFYPKNCAMTNVELHNWIVYPNKFENYRLEEREKEQIIKAGRTSWDNRYGIYLDDGWLYCYRSYSILARFKLRFVEVSHTYMIDDFQISGEHHISESINGVENALYETCRIILRE